ncbi:hypothetical protein GCM10010495_43240 [Kitasatospora herbaricolor]|uniref:DUF6213 family protein n=1 Tax=Kitasatospora herbaricolor TaxID=68217 RepID=UPI001748E252|nr:DUF6213 family protein [Kitasatospora herbaricolor]MDQ0306130.1 hypothetical protein [Kitasatospora herbaricolor]GGV23150.1 hypothetical protein GCM10010495_43240 [Kitasatospora herbaricolor]
MKPLNVPLIRGIGEGLVIPAEQVTALLRGLADESRHWSDSAEAELDPPTVEAVASVLRRIADQIDVECIDFVSVEPL